jgi:undecaprenyl-diphosphatase UppP
LSIWQAFWLALLQGATEILPVSSLGHGVILPSLLGWHVNQKVPTFLPFFVVLHLGTATALLLFFRREWISVVRGFFRTLATRKLEGDPEGRLAWLLLAGTVPAGVVGLVFEKALSANFARPALAACFLVLNGIVLLLGERLRRRRRAKAGASELSFWQAIAVGTSQVLALIPGISRSGDTVVAASPPGLAPRRPPGSRSCLPPRSSLRPGSWRFPSSSSSARPGLSGWPSSGDSGGACGLRLYRVADAPFSQARGGGFGAVRLLLHRGGAQRPGVAPGVLSLPRALAG